MAHSRADWPFKVRAIALGMGLGSLAVCFRMLPSYDDIKTRVNDSATQLNTYFTRNLVRLCAVYSRRQVFHRLKLPNVLVSLGNSANIQLHDMGVKSLSVLHFSSIDAAQHLKQKCKPHLLVSLARTPTISTAWFPVDISKEKILAVSVEELEKELVDLLQFLYRNTSNTCTMWMIDESLKLFSGDLMLEREPHNRELFWSFSEDSLLDHHPAKFSSEKKWSLYLGTLKYATDNKEGTEILVRMNLLYLLKRAICLFSNSAQLLALCTNIVANLALDVCTHQEIISQGFIDIAKTLSSHTDGAVSSAGQRLLYNLDLFKRQNSFLADGIHLIHPDHKVNPEDMELDIVFVHGLTGGPFWTWRQKERKGSMHCQMTSCWPKDWLAKDVTKSRIFCVEYNTHLTDWTVACPYSKRTHTLSARAAELAMKLKQAGIGDRPIVWVTHSMGGLVVKDILAHLNELKEENCSLLGSTRGIVFFSVPHRGSPLAKQVSQAKYIIYPSVEVMDLQQGSQRLMDLHEDFMQTVRNSKLHVLSILESKPLEIPILKLKVKIVPFSSAQITLGTFIQLDRNHVYICKPEDKNDPIYTEVLRLVRNVLRETKHRALVKE